MSNMDTVDGHRDDDLEQEMDRRVKRVNAVDAAVEAVEAVEALLCPSPMMGHPATRDPWAHRSAGMKCATCMWFVCKTVVTDKGIAAALQKTHWIGRCRKHAPTLNGYPVVYTSDWCGDHKLDERSLA